MISGLSVVLLIRGGSALDALLERIELAKNSNSELESLITDYMPFIRKSVYDAGNLDIEYDDKLSLAMLSFMNCVIQFERGRGSFLTFASTCIRNRLFDEGRKQAKYGGKMIPLYPENGQTSTDTVEGQVSYAAYNMKQEQERLADEIDVFSQQLGEYGVLFEELPRICPKQERARKQCVELGQFVAGREKMRETLLKHRRLAQAELAAEFGLSGKTIEKHRKYIVTIVLLLTGDYPLMRAFLPQYKEARL
jgi:RNA polymerase sigma factor